MTFVGIGISGLELFPLMLNIRPEGVSAGGWGGVLLWGKTVVVSVSMLFSTSRKLGCHPGLARNQLCAAVDLTPSSSPLKGPMVPASRCTTHRGSWFPRCQALMALFLLPDCLLGSGSPHPQQLLAVSEDGQAHHRTECLLLLLWLWLLLWARGQGDPRGRH